MIKPLFAFETFSQQSFVATVIKILNDKTIVCLFISLQTLVDQTRITCISIRSDIQLYMHVLLQGSAR
jgi:hypothetical protein